MTALRGLTGTPWQVRIAGEPGEPSLREQDIAAKKAEEQAVLETPLVKAAFEAFPDAELSGFTLDEQRSA